MTGQTRYTQAPARRRSRTRFKRNARLILTRFATVAAAMAMVAGLAACEGTVPVTQPPTSASVSPDMSTAQEKKIRTSILDLIDQADNAKTTGLLGQRMEGPALLIRSSQIDVAKVTGSLDQKTTEIPKNTSQVIIPTNSGWPRSIFTITTTTSDQQSKRLLVMTQDNARSNYKLWAVARLLQGSQLPKFAVPQIGSQMGGPDDTGLVATPAQAVARYADVLQNNSASKYAANFENDAFRQQLDTQTRNVEQGMRANSGSLEQTFTPAKDQIKVMRSADGGDLVVAQIDSVQIRRSGQGHESLPASKSEVALFGNQKVTSTLKATYIYVVAMYVPPAGSQQKIKAVGAEQMPIKAEAL